MLSFLFCFVFFFFPTSLVSCLCRLGKGIPFSLGKECLTPSLPGSVQLDLVLLWGDKSCWVQIQEHQTHGSWLPLKAQIPVLPDLCRGFGLSGMAGHQGTAVSLLQSSEQGHGGRLSHLRHVQGGRRSYYVVF